MHIKIVKVAVINDSNNFAPFIFLSFCEFVGYCFGPRHFSLGAALPQKNTSAQNNHLRFSHNDLKKDGVQLLLSNYNFVFLVLLIGPLLSQSLVQGIHIKPYWITKQKNLLPHTNTVDAVTWLPRFSINTVDSMWLDSDGEKKLSTIH